MVRQFTDEEKMEVVAPSFDDEALSWFRSMEDLGVIFNWNQLKQMVYKKFKPTYEGDLVQRFF